MSFFSNKDGTRNYLTKGEIDFYKRKDQNINSRVLELLIQLSEKILYFFNGGYAVMRVSTAILVSC